MAHSWPKLPRWAATLPGALTFQEYYERLTTAEKWGKPLAALLRTYQPNWISGCRPLEGKTACPAHLTILHVPPTLVSFAVAVGRADDVVSATLTEPEQRIWLLPVPLDRDGLCRRPRILCIIWRWFINLPKPVESGGCHCWSRRSCGCRGSNVLWQPTIAFEAESYDLFRPQPAALLLAVEDPAAIVDLTDAGVVSLGKTVADGRFTCGCGSAGLTHAEAFAGLASTTGKSFPSTADVNQDMLELATVETDAKAPWQSASRVARPRCFIPVFPGTSCEYDTAQAFIEAGASRHSGYCNLTSWHQAIDRGNGKTHRNRTDHYVARRFERR